MYKELEKIIKLSKYYSENYYSIRTWGIKEKNIFRRVFKLSSILREKGVPQIRISKEISPYSNILAMVSKYGEDYRIFKSYAFKRDLKNKYKNSCVICKKTNCLLDRHHIKNSIKHTPNNLIILCKSCHYMVEKFNKIDSKLCSEILYKLKREFK